MYEGGHAMKRIRPIYRPQEVREIQRTIDLVNALLAQASEPDRPIGKKRSKEKKREYKAHIA